VVALRRLAETLGVDPADLEIRKRGRVPELCRRGRPAAADLSLSHHGAVVAFACELFEGRRVSAPRSGQYAGSAS